MRIYSVSEITGEIREQLEETFDDVWIVGEISNFHSATSGHCYFTLKDEKSQIRVAMFRGAAAGLRFRPENGLSVLCYGRVSVYEQRGEYQLIIEQMEPKGVGELQLAFEQLKKKLEGEGLFEIHRKRNIPFLPRKIGIITSPRGAVIKDMIHVLTRRNPNIQIVFCPVMVQGEGAKESIVQAIQNMNDYNEQKEGSVDVIILGRGGGSIEDLWAFNEEIVARAIAASKIPIISAVGHETDFTIADFVADLRAPTPSAAAELAIPVKLDLVQTVNKHKKDLISSLYQKIDYFKVKLREWEAYFRNPKRRLTELLLQVDHLRESLIIHTKNNFQRQSQKLQSLKTHLMAMSPESILKRGYVMALREKDGSLVSSINSVVLGDFLNVRVFDGWIQTRVEATKAIDDK